MRLHRSVGLCLGLAAVLVFSLAGTAAAVGPPEIETETFSETLEDEFLFVIC
jgi:hypothetical protein